jgi:hypothetical protein
MDATTISEMSRLRYKTYNGREDWREGLAKAYAAEHGYFGAQGGWIYRSREGREPSAYVQGWLSFYGHKRTAILDWLTSKLTAFESFTALVRAEGTYRPTILVRKGMRDGWMYEALAEAYDEAQRERGDKRRAHRGRAYYKVGTLGGYFHPTHVVNGEKEADRKGICGMPVQGFLTDLTPRAIKSVDCLACRRQMGLA